MRVDADIGENGRFRCRRCRAARCCWRSLTSARAAALAHAAGVAPAAHDLSSPRGAPFPSDRWTVADTTQLTGLRVDLPKPNCAVRPSDCADIDVLNTLDGFNIQPRLSIPFTGAIDAASVSSSNVFLVRLSGRRRDGDQPGRLGARGEHAARRVGPAARPAHALPARRHERRPGRGGRADRELRSSGSELRPRQDAADKATARSCRGAQHCSRRRRRRTSPRRASSRRRARRRCSSRCGRQIKASTPAPANFQLGTRRRADRLPALDVTSDPVHAADAAPPRPSPARAA